ncbi:MAG: biopolymer transporter ExbD [Myxococcales bacterium]|nr:biopolymer transporter ExbD [Myxococcales bacterium]
MPIVKPGKRPFAPWLLKHSAFSRGSQRNSGYADLLLTPLIDMFVILVVFLIMNFSATGELPIAAGIELPKASVTNEREQAPAIDISEESLSVEGFLVGAPRDLLSEESSGIPTLTEKLQELRKIEEMMSPGEPFKGNIIINCHKAIDFKLIRKVMSAASDAGYTNINFAVLQKGNGEAPASSVGN